MPATWERIVTTGDDSNYKNSNISSSDIPSNAITTAKINDEAVTGAKIEPLAIDSGHLNQGLINDGQLIANDVIDSQHYKDGSIDTAHLATDSVSTAKIQDESVTDGKIADNAVSSSTIQSSAVTNAKIATSAVTHQKLSTNQSPSSGQYLQAQGGGVGMGWNTLTVNNSTWSGTDLSIANGGTGASSASTARGKSNLDVNQAGYLGYSTRIKIKPSDFMPDSDNSTANYAITSADNGGTGRIMSEYLEIIGNFDIPYGFKATHVTLYGVAYLTTSRSFQVYECQIDDNTDVLKGTGSMASSPTTLDITDVTATTTNYLSIRVDLQSTNDRFYGGYITIARV